MRRFGWIPVLVLGLLLVLPAAGYACPACLDLSNENRVAFLQTAAALTLLPLTLAGGAGFWLRKRSRELDEEPFSEEPYADERDLREE